MRVSTLDDGYYYRIAVPPGQRVHANLFANGVGLEFETDLFNENCTEDVGYWDGFGSTRDLFFPNLTLREQDVVLRDAWTNPDRCQNHNLDLSV